MDAPVSIERMRELLKQNAPYVYQQITLRKPLEIEQIKIEVNPPTEPKIISIEEQGAEEFQQYLDDDWVKRNPQISPAGRTQEAGIQNRSETNIVGAIPTL